MRKWEMNNKHYLFRPPFKLRAQHDYARERKSFTPMPKSNLADLGR